MTDMIETYLEPDPDKPCEKCVHFKQKCQKLNLPVNEARLLIGKNFCGPSGKLFESQ